MGANCCMQGYFKSKLPVATDSVLDANASDYLRHGNTVRRIPAAAGAIPPPVPGAAAAAAGGPAGAAAVVAPVAAAPVPVIVYSPMQNFTLAGTLFFIKANSNKGPEDTEEGHWVCQYTKEDAQTAITDGGGVTRQVNCGRADSIREALDASEVDILTPDELLTITPPPNLQYAQVNRHFVLASGQHAEIGEMYLKSRIETAERLDYEFALRMQGLQNCRIDAVWSCTDIGGEAADRASMTSEFLKSYLSRLLRQAPQTGTDYPDNVITEALQMHQQFCSEWVREHKRCLSPAIEASAEALVGMFVNTCLRPAVRPGMTWKDISRLIRRDPILSPQFGLCLHFYMVKLEQDRGSRNASYKSMYNASSSNMLSINSMDSFMRSHAGHLATLASNGLDTADGRMFDLRTIDWYAIMTQLSLPKVGYGDLKNSRVFSRKKRGAAAWGS